MASILIIDDEPVLSYQLEGVLNKSGHSVEAASSASEGLALAEAHAPDLVLLDLRLPDANGLDVIPRLREIDAGIQIVLMTAYGSVRDAVEAIRRGAADYLQKPLDLGELGIAIDRLHDAQRLRRELDYHRERERALPVDRLGRDPRLAEILETVRRLCDPGLSPGRRPPVLLFGEDGSGRSWIARALHEALGTGPFVEVSVQAYAAPERLELELFGAERGPDAPCSHPGLLEAANGGTLLIDRVDLLPARLQERLLEVLDSQRLRRSGSVRARPVDVHVIAKSPRALNAAERPGEILPELSERLSLLAFEVPPLRERPEDVRGLAEHFAFRLGQRHGGLPRTLSEDAHELLALYRWPGNLLELRAVIERAVLLCEKEIITDRLLGPLIHGGAATEAGRIVLPEDGLDLEAVERNLLEQALERTGGNQTRASALLGLSRDTLRYRIGKFGLHDPRA